MNYELMTTRNAPVKMWTRQNSVEDDARQQLINTAKMPLGFQTYWQCCAGCVRAFTAVVRSHERAIIPAAVGDIGCGNRTRCVPPTGGRSAGKSPAELRSAIEAVVLTWRTGRGRRDVGAWETRLVNVDGEMAQLEAWDIAVTQNIRAF